MNIFVHVFNLVILLCNIHGQLFNHPSSRPAGVAIYTQILCMHSVKHIEQTCVIKIIDLD